MDAGGRVTHIPVLPFGHAAGQYGEITVIAKRVGSNLSRARASEKTVSDPFEYFKTKRIPYKTLDQGPLYVEEANLVVFFPRHQPRAYHPGNESALRAQFDQVHAARYNGITHSGIVIYAADCYKRITSLYTTINGHVVYIPVQCPDPENDLRKNIEFTPIGSDTELSLDSHDMILVDYVTDSENGMPACNAVKTYGNSITALLETSHELWKIGDQWFSSNRHALTEQLRRDAKAEPGGINHAVIEAAVEAATHDLTEENLRLENMNTMLQSQVKSLNQQIKASTDFIKDAATGNLNPNLFDKIMAQIKLDAMTLELKAREIEHQSNHYETTKRLDDQTNKVKRTTNYAAIATSAAKCVPVASAAFAGVMKIIDVWKR
jgi:hypothetical protein